ncbi:MAG: phosphotransferase [Alphaproteobacteria bacterium]|nr:phosphotransferase [Alphaproteobacteria bacterium]
MTIKDFLKTNDWFTDNQKQITGDASSRNYTRLKKDNQTRILMDSSKDKESLFRFIQVGKHLESLGMSVPHIFAEDPKNGYLLLEDFGDETFEKCLEKIERGKDLYSLAIETLITLHKIPQGKVVPQDFRRYDSQKMLGDLELFVEMFMKNKAEEVKDTFRRLWLQVLEKAHCVPESMLLRDCHVGNMMYLEKREGINKCGIIDFQDAYLGPITYDLVSLLEDARREIPSTLQHEMKKKYLEAFPKLDKSRFEQSYAILAGLRHARVLGAFRRLKVEMNKASYEERFLSHVRNLFNQALSHAVMKELKKFHEQHNL